MPVEEVWKNDELGYNYGRFQTADLNRDGIDEIAFSKLGDNPNYGVIDIEEGSLWENTISEDYPQLLSTANLTENHRTSFIYSFTQRGSYTVIAAVTSGGEVLWRDRVPYIDDVDSRNVYPVDLDGDGQDELFGTFGRVIKLWDSDGTVLFDHGKRIPKIIGVTDDSNKSESRIIVEYGTSDIALLKVTPESVEQEWAFDSHRLMNAWLCSSSSGHEQYIIAHLRKESTDGTNTRQIRRLSLTGETEWIYEQDAYYVTTVNADSEKYPSRTVLSNTENETTTVLNSNGEVTGQISLGWSYRTLLAVGYHDNIILLSRTGLIFINKFGEEIAERGNINDGSPSGSQVANISGSGDLDIVIQFDQSLVAYRISNNGVKVTEERVTPTATQVPTTTEPTTTTPTTTSTPSSTSTPTGTEPPQGTTSQSVPDPKPTTGLPSTEENVPKEDLRAASKTTIEFGGSTYFVLEDVPNSPKGQVAVTDPEYNLVRPSYAKDALFPYTVKGSAWPKDWEQAIENTRELRERSNRNELFGRAVDTGWDVTAIIGFGAIAAPKAVGPALKFCIESITWSIEATEEPFQEVFTEMTANLQNAKLMEENVEKIVHSENFGDDMNELSGILMSAYDVGKTGVEVSEEIISTASGNSTVATTAGAGLSATVPFLGGLAVNFALEQVEGAVKAKTELHAIQEAYATVRLPVLNRLEALTDRIDSGTATPGEVRAYLMYLYTDYAMGAVVYQASGEYWEEISNLPTGILWDVLSSAESKSESRLQKASLLRATAKETLSLWSLVEARIDTQLNNSLNQEVFNNE